LPIFDAKQADACVLRRRVLIKTWPTVFKLQLRSSWRKLRTPSCATKATASGLHASPKARDRTARVNFAPLIDRVPRLAWPRPERCRTNHLWRGPAETEGLRSSTNRDATWRLRLGERFLAAPRWRRCRNRGLPRAPLGNTASKFSTKPARECALGGKSKQV
jgi:hypothetical protein